MAAVCGAGLRGTESLFISSVVASALISGFVGRSPAMPGTLREDPRVLATSPVMRRNQELKTRCYRTRVIDPNSNLGRLLKSTGGPVVRPFSFFLQLRLVAGPTRPARTRTARCRSFVRPSPLNFRCADRKPFICQELRDCFVIYCAPTFDTSRRQRKFVLHSPCSTRRRRL